MLIGETQGWLGCSLYLRELCGREDGAPPPVDLGIEKRHGGIVRALIEGGLVTACHDVADGGLLVAIAEMCLASGLGATLQPDRDDVAEHAFWFGEDQGRYVVSTPDPAAVANVVRISSAFAFVLGTTTGERRLTVDEHVLIPLDELREAHEAWLPRFMAG